MSSDKLSLGIDLGASKILIVIYDNERQRIIHRAKHPTPTRDGQNAVLQALETHIGDALQVISETHTQPIAIGLGFPGLVNFSTGLTYESIMLPGWQEMNLARFISERVNMPTIVDNDVNTATYAEWKHGSGKGMSNLICLAIGTGIGGGMVINDALYRGIDFTAGEFGNTTIDYQGPEFDGNDGGVLNAFSSGLALEKIAREWIEQNKADDILVKHVEQYNTLSVEDLVQALTQGSETAKTILHRGATLLGIGIANFVNILNPEAVLLGGGVTQIGDWYFNVIRDVVRERAFAVPANRAKILPFALGQDAGAIGAAALAYAHAVET